MRSGTVAGMTGRFRRRRRQCPTVRRGGGGRGSGEGWLPCPCLGHTKHRTTPPPPPRGLSHRGAPSPAGRRPPHAPHSDSSDATAADGDGGGVDGGRCGAGQWAAAAEGRAGGVPSMQPNVRRGKGGRRARVRWRFAVTHPPLIAATITRLGRNGAPVSTARAARRGNRHH